MTLKYRSLMTITAVGIGLALGWGLGTQQIKAQDAKAPAKVWQGKDGGKEKVVSLLTGKKPGFADFR